MNGMEFLHGWNSLLPAYKQDVSVLFFNINFEYFQKVSLLNGFATTSGVMDMLAREDFADVVTMLSFYSIFLGKVCRMLWQSCLAVFHRIYLDILNL